MRLSIVVPSRGGAGRLPRLLDSLARQDDGRFEVVVVLDGDVDGSAGVLAARRDLPLRVVALPSNRGRAAALNAGVAASRGEVVARCDDDLELPASYVAAQLRRHERPVGVIGLCANVYPVRTPYAAAYGERADRDLHAVGHACPPGSRWRFWGGNVSARREDLDAVGPYDEEFTGYGWEDVDWGYRLHRLGRELVVAPELAARHHVAATTTVVRALRAYDSGAAQVRFERKHGIVVDGSASAPRTAWQHAVARRAGGLDRAGVAAEGVRVDRRLALLPRPLARKRVALLVEAAARAGYAAATARHEVPA